MAATGVAPGRRRLYTTTSEGVHGVFAAVAGILCFLLPGWLDQWTFTTPFGGTGSVRLQWAIVVWAGLRLAWVAAKASARPMVIMWWLFVYVWMGLAPLLQVVASPSMGQFGPWPYALSNSIVVHTQIGVLLGLFVYEVGYGWRGQRPVGTSSHRQINPQRVTVLAVVTLLAAPVLYVVSGGSQHFHSRQAITDSLFQGGATISSAAIRFDTATVLSFVAVYALLVSRRFGILRVRQRSVVVLVVAAAIVLNYPVSQPRFWIGTILAALVFVIPALFERPLGVRLLVAIILVGGVALFPYAAYFRYGGGANFKAPSVTQDLISSGDYDSGETTAAAFQYAQDHGFAFGRHLAGDLFFFIPRSVWHGKPLDSGVMLAQSAGFSFTNLSCPLWGELYLDFGFYGIIVGFLLLGYFSRRLDDAFLLGRSALAQFSVPLIAGYSVIMLRGSLLQSMARIAIIGLLTWFLMGRRRRWTRREPQPILEQQTVISELRKTRPFMRDRFHPQPSSLSWNDA